MMDAEEQLRWLRAIVAAAKEEGCVVAPVGSIYFLLQGRPGTMTKDVDAVIHLDDLEVAPVDAVKRIAARLGEATITVDEAVVWVKLPTGDKLELIRGRAASKGGFFPRGLLRDAARAAEMVDGALIYPIEHVLVLKADAAIDRRSRARRDPERAEDHLRRATIFEADVFNEVQRASLTKPLNPHTLTSAIGHLKASRRRAILAMLQAAGLDLGEAEGTLT